MQARSEARSTAVPGGQNMPKLPLEIIQLIFTTFLPPRPTYDDRSRLAFLLPLCLVHRSLTRSIQRILFANVCLVGMLPLLRFLESLKLVPEFRRWVKTLELDLYDLGTGRGAQGNDALSCILNSCVNIEKVGLFWVEEINLALFAQLKHLRSLKCFWLELAYFEPIVGQSRTLDSLVSLSIVGGAQFDLSDSSFFAPEVLPSLRRLSINPGGDEGPIDSATDLYDIASQLRHLSVPYSSERLSPLLDPCTHLLSLAITSSDNVPSTRRLGKPLVGLRLWSNRGEQGEPSAIRVLKEALSSGLISASADSRTGIFPYGDEKDDARESGLSEWAESVGLELNYYEGAREEERSNDGWDEGYSEFTEWVDEEAARREAVAEQRKIKRQCSTER